LPVYENIPHDQRKKIGRQDYFSKGLPIGLEGKILLEL